jgi:DNA-binding NtrC family response regulator
MDRALIADDDKNIRHVLKETLAAIPLDVDTAEDGDVALKLLDNHSYCVLLLDLRMPGMDGIEVLRRVRDIHPELPVILLTAHGTIDVAVEAMKLGAIDFLQKPFDPDQLRQLVKRVLARHGLQEDQTHDYAAYFELAKKCVAQRNLQGAMSHLHTAIALSANRPEAFNMLGALYEIRHNMPEALKNYRVALDLDPTYAPAQKNLDRAVTIPQRRGQILLGDLRDAP